MIGGPIQDQRAAVLAQLNASIDSFFLQGGTVHELKGFQPIPRRPHHGPGATSSDPAILAAVQAQNETVQGVKQAAESMPLAQAAQELGMGRTELLRMSKEHGFFFMSNNKERLQREAARLTRAEERTKLVALLRELSGTGLSSFAASKRAGVSPYSCEADHGA
jgi:hypothetical protein